MTKIFKSTVFLIILFVYIYNISFIGLKYGFVYYMGIYGIYDIFIKKRLKKNDSFYNYLRLEARLLFKELIPYLVFVAIAASLSIIINQTTDFHLIKWCILVILELFGAYTLIRVFYWAKSSNDSAVFIKYLLYAALLQCGLSTFIMLFPNQQYLLTSIFAYDDIFNMVLERTIGSRLIGFGTAFFNAGLVQGFVLIAASILFMSKSKIYSNVLIRVFTYFIIFIISMMLARVTLVGFLISLFIMLFGRKLSFSSFMTVIKVAISLLILYFVLTAILSNLSRSLLESIENMKRFGFEMVYSYFEGDGLQVHSLDRLEEMNNTYPNNLKTWIIGDAMWDDTKLGYYMKVDTWLRWLYYFGIVGIISLLCFIFKSLSLFNNRNKYITILICFSLFIYTIVLNLKGACVIFYLYAPFYFCNVLEKYENKRC